MDFDLFVGRNVTDKVSNQKALYCVTSSNLCFCSTWQNGETRKLHFSLKCCISALPEFNQSAWFIKSFWLTTHIHTTVWLPKSCNQCVHLRAVGGMVQEKGSRQRCSSWTVLHAQCTSVLSSGFPLSQGNAEALDRWDGKTKASSNFGLSQ